MVILLIIIFFRKEKRMRKRVKAQDKQAKKLIDLFEYLRILFEDNEGLFLVEIKEYFNKFGSFQRLIPEHRRKGFLSSFASKSKLKNAWWHLIQEILIFHWLSVSHQRAPASSRHKSPQHYYYHPPQHYYYYTKLKKGDVRKKEGKYNGRDFKHRKKMQGCHADYQMDFSLESWKDSQYHYLHLKSLIAAAAIEPSGYHLHQRVPAVNSQIPPLLGTPAIEDFVGINHSSEFPFLISCDSLVFPLSHLVFLSFCFSISNSIPTLVSNHSPLHSPSNLNSSNSHTTTSTTLLTTPLFIFNSFLTALIFRHIFQFQSLVISSSVISLHFNLVFLIDSIYYMSTTPTPPSPYPGESQDTMILKSQLEPVSMERELNQEEEARKEEGNIEIQRMEVEAEEDQEEESREEEKMIEEERVEGGVGKSKLEVQEEEEGYRMDQGGLQQSSIDSSSIHEIVVKVDRQGRQGEVFGTGNSVKGELGRSGGEN
ncbi:hypothetical protein VP01_4674g1 [Puccinia sorghi]|uniref:Uncharacterized protein n=1 Tax=Puccinia sorghi TaxID=27349 RepID=A0A0L6UN45_9BASI|nr:hypothetical protein VP01_4674g1 [Puccinia sorghi]